MKLADMNPNTGLAFRPVGRNVNISTWRIIDFVNEDYGYEVRRVYHHGTLMGEWYRYYREADADVYDMSDPVDAVDFELNGPDEEFFWAPLSTGWGSVSDQQGLNRMLVGTGWRFVRSGGVPRYVHENGRQFPH